MSRIRVLVVDDSAFMRGVISRTLAADTRFEVVGQAADGSEAVRLSGELKPDVVTMDYNMPGLNGAEATRRIAAEYADRAREALTLLPETPAREVLDAAVDYVLARDR